MTRVELPPFEVDCVSRGNRTYVAIDSLNDYLEAIAQLCDEEETDFTARMLRALRAQFEIGQRMSNPL